VKRFLPVVQSALKKGNNFADATIAGYTAVLCSPEFVYLEEKTWPARRFRAGGAPGVLPMELSAR